MKEMTYLEVALFQNLKTMKIYKVSLIIFSISMMACKEKVVVEKKIIGTDFNPIHLNSTWIYQGDSTIYDDFTGDSIQISFQYKDSLLSIETPNQDTIALIERKIRYSDTSTFVFLKDYTFTKNNLQFILNENGINFCKLVYPLQLNMQWDGNQYNHFGESKYELIQYNNPKLVLNQSTESVKILEKNDTNLIREDYQESEYGKLFGLIYFKSISVDKDISTGAITSGNSVTLRLISYTH